MSQEESYVNELNGRFSQLARLNMEIGQSLASLDYPFEHAQEGVKVAGQVFGGWPPGDEPGPAIEGAQAVVERLPNLQWRLITRLTEIAEQVETALGYEPLKIEVETISS